MPERKTVGQLMEEMRLKAGAQNYHGHEYMDLERFAEDTRHMIIPADPDVRNFSFTVVDGKIYYRENSRMNPVEVSMTAENRIKGMISIRDCVRTLIEYQTEDYPDADIQAEQEKLNGLYDDFSKKYRVTSGFTVTASHNLRKSARRCSGCTIMIAAPSLGDLPRKWEQKKVMT